MGLVRNRPPLSPPRDTPRPFLHSTMEKYRDQVADNYRKVIRAALDGAQRCQRTGESAVACLTAAGLLDAMNASTLGKRHERIRNRHRGA
jgi:hypothetical protein